MWVSTRTIVSCTRSSARSLLAVSETAKARSLGTIARISPRNAGVSARLSEAPSRGFGFEGIGQSTSGVQGPQPAALHKLDEPIAFPTFGSTRARWLGSRVGLWTHAASIGINSRASNLIVR